MKKLHLFAVILVLVAVLVMGYAALNANSLVTKYKPDIEKTLGKTMKRSVSLGEIELSLFPSLKLKVKEISLKERKKSKEALTLQNLYLHLSLWRLLTGKLAITDLSL